MSPGPVSESYEGPADPVVLTCAFCGEQYPPGTPHEALTAHVYDCRAHPLGQIARDLGAQDKLGEQVCVFNQWLDTAAEQLDAGIGKAETASEGSLALTAAAVKLAEIIAGPDESNDPTAEQYLERAAQHRQRAFDEKTKPLDVEIERLRNERDAIVKELDETREKHLREARAADEARDDFETLRAQLSALRAERDHWKANHDEAIARQRLLTDRPDLPVERVRAAEALRAAQVELASLRPAADALALISDERQRQISAEGWTHEHDDAHDNGSLGAAASCYALPVPLRSNPFPRFWPWDPTWWKPTPGDRIRELVKAGALIVAEIERIKREKARAGA